MPGEPSWLVRCTPGDVAGEDVPGEEAEEVGPEELAVNRDIDCVLGRAIAMEKVAVGVVGLFSPEACPLGVPS